MDCYVLTGGRSERMGQSKAALFLDQVVAAAAPAFDRVVAVQRRGMPSLAVTTIFEEEHGGEGPAFAVARALEDASGPCFILAVDFAFIRAEVLRYLRARFETCNASILVPIWDGVPQVLCAGYRTCVAPALNARIRSGRLDLQGLLDEADGETLSEASLRSRFAGEPLKNVNTPADLTAAERLR